MRASRAFVVFGVLACARTDASAPTAPSETPAAAPVPYDDPLAELDAPTPTVEISGGFRGCQTDVDAALLRVTVTASGPGRAQAFDGCDEIMTPYELTVESAENQSIAAGTTIRVWEVGGEVKNPDGSTRMTMASRTCGRLPASGEKAELCVQRAADAYVIACCTHEGSKTTRQQ